MRIGPVVIRACAVLACLLVAAINAGSDEDVVLAPNWQSSATRVLRVALCQIYCITGDLEGNLRRIEYALEEAAVQQADLACFPESAILGWVNPEAHHRADPVPGPTTERLSQMARRHCVMICIGLDEKDGEKLYDSAVLIGADGTLLLKQRKIDTLRGQKLMDPPYSDGSPRDLRVVETALGRIGILICADSFEEALVREIARFSPDLLLVPVGWAAEPLRWPQHGQVLANLMIRAARWADCPVISTNCVGMIIDGPWRGSLYGGQSVVTDRVGGVLAVLRDRDVDVRVIEVAVGRSGSPE